MNKYIALRPLWLLGSILQYYMSSVSLSSICHDISQSKPVLNHDYSNSVRFKLTFIKGL